VTQPAAGFTHETALRRSVHALHQEFCISVQILLALALILAFYWAILEETLPNASYFVDIAH